MRGFKEYKAVQIVPKGKYKCLSKAILALSNYLLFLRMPFTCNAYRL